ncbi:MAG: permease prefix domain 1-containing protein [Clostridium sp.]
MNSLKDHVNSMFSKYKENKQIKELKDEVLSNLEAKVDDLTASGMEYNEAINKAKESINNIDYLIEGNREVYINKYTLEYMQIVLLYSIVAWIITIPGRIVGVGSMINTVLFICSITIGLSYMVLNKKGDSEYFQYKSFMNIESAYKARKIAWIVWFLFIVVSILCITVIQFGSNIWFSRPIRITGPYQFAVITIMYLIPFVTIAIPLIFNVSPKLIFKYEVGE